MRSGTRTVASAFVAFPALVVGLVLGSSERVRAGPLNPFDFASLGAFPSLPLLIFNTGGTPTITAPDGSIVATGVVYNGIAVFDFDSINIPGNGIFGPTNRCRYRPIAAGVALAAGRGDFRGY